MTPKERAKDRRLWKNYRWTLAMYNALGELQDWRCAGCGREAINAPLNLDHEHVKITAHRIITDYPSPQKMWEAKAVFKDGRVFTDRGLTKIDAINKVRETTLPQSVRGLLCPGRHFGCNRLLGRIDKIVWLEAMIKYLKDPPARKILPAQKADANQDLHRPSALGAAVSSQT